MIGTARVDQSGRVQHGRILHALRWRPSQELSIDIAGAPAGDVTALLITPARDRIPSVAGDWQLHMWPRNRRTSWCRIDARGAITLPAAARTHCGITAGSTVVLVAEPVEYRLIALSTATAVGLLVGHIDSPRSGPTALADNTHGGHQDER